MADRVIHVGHPNGAAHPFKASTLCGKLVRFGGMETDKRKPTCKVCVKIKATICPTCKGTGVKNE